MRKIKYTKVFWNGARLKDIAVGTNWYERLIYKTIIKIRQAAILTLVIGSLYGAVQFSGLVDSNAMAYTAPVEIIKEVEGEYPVLQRIAKCESNNTHFDKNGQVLMRSNVNKTVDVGKYQLNSVWFKKATELGLDITKEKDNEKMAIWIYKNRGTNDWYSSANCWQK